MYKIKKFIDLTGTLIGRLTPQWPIGYNKDTSERNVVWLCSCSCGNTKLVPSVRLTQKNATKSCGCLVIEKLRDKNRGSIIDLRGKTFGRLLVTEWKDGEKGGVGDKGRGRWVCKCSCRPDIYVEVRGGSLIAGGTQSCGCLKHDSMLSYFTTHGQAPSGGVSPEYSTWSGMVTRCTNPKSKSYSYYGGRGIKVCDRWLGKDGFSHFFEDMGERPKPKVKYSLNRINNDGNYEPTNCSWDDWKTQNNNRRNPISRSKVTRLEKASGMSIDELIEFYENKPILY
jgi:hypothetical protein